MSLLACGADGLAGGRHRFGGGRCRRLLQGGLHLARRQLVAADGREQVVDLFEVQQGGELVEAERGHAGALQHALDDLPALVDGGFQVLRVEPLAHLGARARAVDDSPARG